LLHDQPPQQAVFLRTEKAPVRLTGAFLGIVRKTHLDGNDEIDEGIIWFSFTYYHFIMV
jgi:hypothetical protein